MKKRIIVPIIAAGILFISSSFKSDFFEIAKQIEIFTNMFKEINMNYVDEVNPAELMDSAIKSMLSELDPYTKFLNEQDVEAAKIKNTGHYSGIGAIIRREDDKVYIVEPYKDSPADKAGLKAGDAITKIGDVIIADFKDDTTTLLKGAANTTVEVTFYRNGQKKTATIERDEIAIDAVPFYEMIDDKTGYIAMVKFNRKASPQTKAAIEDLKSQGAERLILDLRGNPGGLLSEAVNMTNLFVPKDQVIVTTKSKVKKFTKTYKTKQEPTDLEIPVAVLINGRSASASEIVSGSLQDLDRAVIVGSRSFGKGLVQRPKKLTYGTQVKVTISRYYTPSGRCIQSLDYWNRDKDGKAVRTDEKDYNEFKTKNGRSVFDGGGVNPDVQIESQKNSAITKALLRDHVMFNYANEFVTKKQFASIDQFQFTDADYADFKKFVAQNNFEYETKTEQELEKVLTVAKDEEIDQGIQSSYDALIQTIGNQKIAALDTYRPQIEKILKDQLLKRYFYREGLYEYNLQNDEAIKEATAILADPKRYEKILK